VPKKATKKRKRKIQREITEVWTERLLKRKHKLIKVGDDEGLRKLELGRFICSMRLNEKRSQQEAADFADIGRCQWNRIEMGHALPHLSTLEKIAEAIRTDISRLKERAGYAGPKVPLEVGQAFRRFRTSIEHSRYTVEFLTDMCLLWQEFKAEEFAVPKRLEVNIRIPEAVAFVKTRLPISQQLQLIFAVGDSLSPQQWRLEGFERRSLIQLIDQRLSDRRILKELGEQYEEP
jgi:transcriptional regulator with XRE-family HTH domain